MIKIEKIETLGWEAAFRGMRNPMNSWDKSDSRWVDIGVSYEDYQLEYELGQNDLDLAYRLIKAGTEHRKFLRMVHVQMDITAPMFFWAEHDTYKVATTRNSCSKMHKIHVKPFELDDFAHEGCEKILYASMAFNDVVIACEHLRKDFNKTHDRKYWRALIELLPESYMMKATWDGSMETLLSMMKQRDNHKLKEEWEPFRQKMFDNVPYLEKFYEAFNRNEKENNND